MKKSRIFGERLLVEKIITPAASLMEKEQFKGEVLVLAIGEGAKDWGISEGDKLIVSGHTDFNEETYVHKSQIMRWI